MTTYNWIVDADGNWATESDWSPTGAPASGDDVVIATSDFHTVTLDTGSVMIADLTLGADALVIAGGSEIEIAGTVTNAGHISITEGTLKLEDGGAIDNGTNGTISIAAGSSIEAATGTTGFANAGAIETSGSGTAFIAVNLTSTGAITIGAGILQLDGAANDISGTVAGAGTLDLDAGNTIIRGGTHLAISTIELTDPSAKLSFFTNFTYAGTLDLSAGTLVLWGGRLKLSGTSMIEGAVIGTGALVFTGGTETIGSGASLAVYRWSLASGAAVSVETDLAYARKLDLGRGCTLSVASGDTLSLDDRATISGSVTGLGTLAFTGGNEILNGTVALAVANWGVSGTADVRVNVSVTYAGTLDEANGAQIQIHGAHHTLTLTGTDKIDGAVNGTGTLALDGATVTFGPGALVYMRQWRLLDGATAVVDTALTYTQALVDTAGTGIVIENGDALTLYGAVTGDGRISLAKEATLTLNGTVAAGQDIAFTGADGTLTLTQPQGFAADVAGFSAGDSIDVANSRFAFGADETIGYSGSATGGTLTLTTGRDTLALTLFGQYTAAGFHIAGDGQGGTLITYTPPQTPITLGAHG